MIEEPYRWIEAIANRREYIETQLVSGSPVAAVGCREGIVLITSGRVQQKLFEIYDRIAMGAIGHPGDIERLRMAAIELASTEGFTRSAADVSLRRLAYYSLSPVLKTAFEQVYGAPYLARMLLAEIGNTPDEDLFVRVEYDGAIAANGGRTSSDHCGFGVISGTQKSTELMEAFLQREWKPNETLSRGIGLAVDAWITGKSAQHAGEVGESPDAETLAAARRAAMESSEVEGILLERDAKIPIHFRRLTRDEIHSATHS